MEESGATIETGHLPLVLGEMPLLTAVFFFLTLVCLPG
jgi:hypothetical protein